MEQSHATAKGGSLPVEASLNVHDCGGTELVVVRGSDALRRAGINLETHIAHSTWPSQASLAGMHTMNDIETSAETKTDPPIPSRMKSTGALAGAGP